MVLSLEMGKVYRFLLIVFLKGKIIYLRFGIMELGLKSNIGKKFFGCLVVYIRWMNMKVLVLD